tara:strand:+ start:54 stop:329 length:276 start_codon:yes stop_codon:yes gene_type:complete
MYKFLENVVALEASLMQDVIANEGVDQGMANMYAQDRNDVITAKELYIAGEYEMLKGHIDYLDTSIREGVVIAFAADLGSIWVANNLGWSV